MPWLAFVTVAPTVVNVTGTDTGSLQHNQTLSEARAHSVAKALVESYGIAATRLEGYGVGPLAPVATNASDAGRARNRRVELVAR